jgi:hypothetical protein
MKQLGQQPEQQLVEQPEQQLEQQLVEQPEQQLVEQPEQQLVEQPEQQPEQQLVELLVALLELERLGLAELLLPHLNRLSQVPHRLERSRLLEPRSARSLRQPVKESQYLLCRLILLPEARLR